MQHDTRWSRALHPTRRLGLSPSLAGETCALLVAAVVDPAVGEEVVVGLLAATEDEAQDLAATEPLRLAAVPGVIPTQHGPVLHILWTVADPLGGWEPRALHQTLLDPADRAALAALRRLASQSCWHLAVVGPNRVVRRWVELRNGFGLGEALEACVELARPLGPTDLVAAAAAIARRWTALDLLAAHDPPPATAQRFLVDDLAVLLAHAIRQRDREAARGVAAIAAARGGQSAMELVLATCGSRYRTHPGVDPDLASRWWSGVAGWRG